MPKIKVLNQEGKSVGEITLNEAVFGIEPNKQAMFDAIVAQRASWRQGTHDVKNRREVAGGGRKPWRQKGTGRARQGSIRSPQWRGGGIVFGPTPRKYNLKVNKKVAKLAIKSMLSQKLIDESIVVLDALKFDAPKTKDFIKVVDALKVEKKTLFVVSENEDCYNAYLSARNIPNVIMLFANSVGIYEYALSDKIVFTTAAINQIQEGLSNE